MLSNAGILYPCCKCSCLTAARYTLIVLCDVLELANAVQNLHSNCSDVGVGDACNCSHNSFYFFNPALYVLAVDGAIPESK